MVVGVARVDMHIPGCRSLKEKRRHVKGLIDRVRVRFGVSVAEVDHLRAWQRTTLGVACVSNSSAHASRVLDAVVRFMDRADPLVMVDVTIQML